MIQRKYETVVGLFVVASVAALLVMVVIIAQQERLWEDKVEYQAIFRNISGLKKGSEVRLAGVTVGNVKEVSVGPGGNVLVIFEVLGKYRDQIRWDSRASIGWQGLLGEKSLDLSAGSPTKPPIPPEGLLEVVEPLDLIEMLAWATPGFENLQKILNNLAGLTGEMRDPKSGFNQMLDDLQEIVDKINHGKGTLGLVLNDPVLYREAAESVAGVRKFIGHLEESKGLMGTLINDPAFKAQFQKTLADFQATFGNLKQATGNLKEFSARLPEMAKKGERFLDSLNKAGQGLPDLVDSGQGLVEDADKVAKAAQKSWLLRRNVPQPKEHTIRVERDPGKEKE
ncbi:MAG: MlaD family protein [Desulfobaccales bacterium]|nr:MlaD family protein [Desulfobaccales bacterium]